MLKDTNWRQRDMQILKVRAGYNIALAAEYVVDNFSLPRYHMLI